MTLNEEQLDRLGRLADTLENTLFGTRMPMPATFHLDAVKTIAREVRDEIATLYREVSGEDPWETNPFAG